MKYLHILAAFASEYWAMEPGKLMAIVDWLELYGRWCGAGFEPETYWRQTPRLLVAALQAKLDNDHRGQLAQGWWAERFAREKRLKNLGFYLAPPAQRDRGADLLAHMQSLKKSGKLLRIRKVV